MKIKNDLTGIRYGRWVVIKPAKNVGSRTFWLCRCDCGTEKEVMAQSLRGGVSRSCGCYATEVKHRKGKNTTHSLSDTRTYSIWCKMKRRCLVRSDPAYSRYGGRGITCAEHWKTFEGFYADMGECPPGLTLERVNNNGNYCKENCRWATYAEQNLNKRNSRRALYQGEMLPLIEIQKRSGLKYSTVYYRACVAPREDVELVDERMRAQSLLQNVSRAA